MTGSNRDYKMCFRFCWLWDVLELVFQGQPEVDAIRGVRALYLHISGRVYDDASEMEQLIELLVRPK